MAQENQLDGISIPLRLPFDAILSDLDPAPRIVSGLNNQTATGGFLKKRGSMSQVAAASTIGANKRIDRLYCYTTMGASPKSFVMASVYDTVSTTWSVYYTRPSAPTVWTQITSYRDINASTRPHEMCESRGLLYVKGYPANASSEKLGTVVFNGDDLTVKPWGALGPSTAARMTNQYKTGDALYSAWTSSAHPFTVSQGWQYTYAYKSLTGHITNRSPLETNYDFPSSNTGAFSNLLPKLTYVVPADPTNFPTVVVFRTTDGGGTWYELDTIDVSAMTPSSSQTYTDNSFVSGLTGGTVTTTLNGGITSSVLSLVVASATNFPGYGDFAILIGSEYIKVTAVSGTTFTIERGFAGTTAASHSNGATITYYGLDPVPDSQLDKASVAPTLTSNSPPPTVLAEDGGIVGTTTPQPSTPIVKFAGRLWYGIGNVLFYSALEELDQGKPEEAWPSGTLGNFFRLQEPLVGMVSTAESLYIFTTRRTYWLKGFDKPSFSIQPLFTDVGAKDGWGMCAKGDVVYWVSNNNRIFRARDNQKEPIGDPLGAELATRLAPSNGVSNLRLYLTSYQVDQLDWVVLQATNISDASLTRTFVFDLQQEGIFWYTPWDLPVSCIASGQIYETDTKDYLIGSGWNRSTNTVSLNYYQDDGAQDYVPSAAQNYTYSYKTNLFGIPSGNNVNTYKKPTFVPCIYAVVFERKKFTSDTEPTLTFFIDSMSTSVASGTAYPPPRRSQSTDYLAYKYCDNIYKVGERIGINVAKSAVNEKFECHGMRIIWEYTGGIGY